MAHMKYFASLIKIVLRNFTNEWNDRNFLP